MIRFLFRLFFKAVSLLLFVGVAFLAYYLYSTGQLPYLRGAIEDTTVTGSIKAAFAVHRELSRRPLEVRTQQGVVTLSGAVVSEDERSEAVELARSVVGVVEVEDGIELEPSLKNRPAPQPGRSIGRRLDDAALLAKIRTALHLDRDVRKLELDVQVTSGDVVLRGRVPSEELKERVRSRVASVDGVESLLDELALEAER